MRLPTRLFLAAIVGVLATAAACSDSSTSPPPPPTPGTLAQHFDTLYQHAKASSVSDTNFKFRLQLLNDLELGAAFGAAPTTITVTTSAGAEEWKGFVVQEVASSLDSVYFVIAYRDSLVHTGIIAGLSGGGASLGTILVTNDTLRVNASSGSSSASRVSVGAACPAPIAGLVNPIIATAQTTTCTSAVFHAAVTANFPATTGADAALTLVSFPTTTFAGERFLDPPTSGGQARLASLLRGSLEAAH